MNLVVHNFLYLDTLFSANVELVKRSRNHLPNVTGRLGGLEMKVILIVTEREGRGWRGSGSLTLESGGGEHVAVKLLGARGACPRGQGRSSPRERESRRLSGPD